MSGVLSLDASGEFSGNDGRWSTFPFQVGTPPQIVHLLPATSGQETWVNTAQVCAKHDYRCEYTRGHLFDWSNSTTWSTQGTYNLDWKAGNEVNIGSSHLNATGYFGSETIASGSPGSESVQVNRSIVAAISSGPFIGQVGLSPRPTYLNSSKSPQSSFLTLLKESQHISSLSYGYTAGASYRGDETGIPGSLTLGGYDRSRFLAHNMSFDFTSDSSTDLVVQLAGIQGLSSKKGENSTVRFLSKPLQVLINSAVPHIWLPEEVCSIFAAELGLMYNPRSNYYTIDEQTRAKNSQENRTFVFNISPQKSTSLKISIPWIAFDLSYAPDDYDMSIRYFPLRQTIDPSDRNILGRAFLQEVYLIVDYEQRNFSLYQAQFKTEKDIVALGPTAAHPPRVSATPDPGRSPPPGTHHGNIQKLKLPLSIGIALTVTILLLAGFFLWKRRKNKKATSEESAVEQAAWHKPEMEGVDARHEAESNPIGPELDAGLRPELYGCEKMPHLLNGMPTPVEMGTDSAIHEASAGSTEDLSEDTRTGVAP